MDEELQLIRKIQKRGDHAAADALVRKYYDEMYAYVCRQTPDRHTAMDLTQEIFISMLRTLPGYDRKQAGFRTWLYKVATNKVVDWFRSRSYRALQETLSLEDTEPVDAKDFTGQILDGALAEQICARVGDWPPDSQKIFRLHVFGARTFAEIAEDLRMPESSVKSKYYRLIHLLRKEFSPW